MTIRFLTAWNGYSAGDVATLSNEAALIAGGIARLSSVVDGPFLGAGNIPTLDREGTAILNQSTGEQVAGRALVMSTTPVALAPSGSITSFGVLALGTALNTIYSEGIYLYFPAGAVFAGSAAGLYWTVMSSTTAGVVYNNVLSGIPERVVTPTAVTATGPGAYTQTINTLIPLITVPTIAANFFGTAEGFMSELFGSNNNSAGGKTTRITMNGASIGGATTSTGTNNSQRVTFKNIGNGTKNVVNFQNFGDSAYGQARSNTTVDTTQAVTMLLTAQIVNVADWVSVDTWWVRKLGK